MRLSWGKLQQAVTFLMATFNYNGPLTHFVPEACQAIETVVGGGIVGQDKALDLVLPIICEHLSARDPPPKPLVLSIHGMPGIGKSYFHALLAGALYGAARKGPCNPDACAAYKILFSVDWKPSEVVDQVTLLQFQLTNHLRRYKESVIVIEEYDKMPCMSRVMLMRMLLKAFAATNLRFTRSIVVLESNTAWLEIRDRLQRADGDPSMEELQNTIKDELFRRWSTQTSCDDRVEVDRHVLLPDHYVPFLPLGRASVAELFRRALQSRNESYVEVGQLASLSWDPELVDFLVEKVAFEGPYALEGGSDVGHKEQMYVAPAMRRAVKARAAELENVCVDDEERQARLHAPLRDCHVALKLEQRSFGRKEVVARAVCMEPQLGELVARGPS